MTPNEAAAPTRIDRSLKTRRVKLSALVADEANKRTHDERNLAAIEESIRKHGVVEPLVVQKGTNRIVAGNGRAEALRRIGYTHVDVVDVEIATEEEFRALSIRLNRTGELAGWDGAGLEADLAMLAEAGWGNLPEFGFDEAALDALSADMDGAETTKRKKRGGEPRTVTFTAGDEQTPDVSDVVHSKPGEVYQLGPHRLMCGDCRNPVDVAKLLDGRKINIAFTSPPYASQREYDPESGFKPIPPDQFVAWFDAVQSNVKSNLADDGSWFVNIKEHCEDGARHLYVKDLTIAHARAWGWRFVDELCWKHHGFPGEIFDRFRNAWEPVFHYGTSKRVKFRPDAVAYPSDSVIEYESAHRMAMTSDNNAKGGETRAPGMAYPRNVIEVSNGASTSIKGHAATFPIALPEWFIKAYSDVGDVVFDPFLGSGTTLIAAAKTERIAYGMEISPKYCDVIRRRWFNFAKANELDAGSGALEPVPAPDAPPS